MQEMEFELENEFELEGEAFVGGLESEFEFENEGEGSLGELESEFELENEGEQFFGGLAKKIGGFIRKAAPMLKQIAKVAAPAVGTAIGGPFGGKIGSLLSGALGEGEFEALPEFELESENENEGEFESVMSGPLSEQQSLGELMAAIASNAATEAEAEAQIGGAIVISLSPAERQALRNVIPALTSGASMLTRLLRRHPTTRPAIRVVPTIIKRSVVTLKKQAAGGLPITKQVTARAVANQTRKVLTTPVVCARAMQRNIKATKAATHRAPTHRRTFAY